MSGAKTKDSFIYDGQLVFNGLYITDVLNPDIGFERVVDTEMTDFVKGSPDKPSKGYELLHFSEEAQNSIVLDEGLQKRLSNVRGVRRKYEVWQSGETPNGEIHNFRDVDSYDIYWDFPSYIFVKGNKTQARNASNIIEYKFGDYMKWREIEFDSDFLLWLFYKFQNDEQTISDNLTINLLSDAKIEGKREDRYGKRSQVDKSTDITKSTTVLIGLLKGKNLIGLEGVFDVDGNFIKANIDTDGRVHVKVEHAIEDSEQIERMALALSFLQELLSLYKEWGSKPSEEKFPPVDFFEEIYKECERQGAEPTFSFDNVLEAYRRKRTKGVDQQVQAGLTEFE